VNHSRLIYVALLSQTSELQIAMRRKAVPKKTIVPDHREFVSGFIRLHILHHASQEPLVGYWMIEELRRHGYEMSPGRFIRCCIACKRRDTYRSK
jgi:hypothetical protein